MSVTNQEHTHEYEKRWPGEVWVGATTNVITRVRYGDSLARVWRDKNPRSWVRARRRAKRKHDRACIRWAQRVAASEME